MCRILFVRRDLILTKVTRLYNVINKNYGMWTQQVTSKEPSVKNFPGKTKTDKITPFKSTLDKAVLKSYEKHYVPANKVTIVGTGNAAVASTFALLCKDITKDICMIDVDDNKLKGEELDLKYGAYFLKNPNITASKEHSASANSKICVVAAGTEQSMDESEYDFMVRNTGIIQAVIPELMKYSPNAVYLIASEPVDMLTYHAWRAGGMSRSRIMGTGTNLDSARFRYMIADRLGVSASSCLGLVVGRNPYNPSSGDKDGGNSYGGKVPIWSQAAVSGVRLMDVNPKIGTKDDPEHWLESYEQLLKNEDEIRQAKGGYTWAHALSIADICDAILTNSHGIRTVSTLAKGEYSITENVFISLPCVLGINGITDIVRQNLTEYEAISLRRAARENTESQEVMSVLRHTGTLDKLFQPVQCKRDGGGNKITVVGVGQVGMAAIISLLTQNVTNDICMIDAMPDRLKGEMMDLQHGSPFLKYAKITGSTDYAVSAGSKICVITAGVRQKGDETRLDLLQRNTEILKNIIPQLMKHSPDTILMLASNPVDILTWVSWKISKLPMNRVIGSGCNLDTARFRYLLAQKLGVTSTSAHGYIIGEHGDTSVPVWSGVNIAGVRLTDLNPQMGTESDPENWKEIHKKVVTSASEIIKMKGFTSWAIGLSITEMCCAILSNANSVHPVTTCLKGEHGITDEVFLSLPCVLGRCGVTDVIRQPLTDTEQNQLRESAQVMAKIQADIKI